MRKLSLVMSAAVMTATLTACPKQPLPELAQPTDLSGKVSVLQVSGTETSPKFEQLPWTAGQKTVQLLVLSDKLPKDIQAATVATGSVSAGGDLSLKLPATVPSSLLSSNAWKVADLINDELNKDGFCTDANLQVSDPAANVGLGALMMDFNASNPHPRALFAGPLPLFDSNDLSFNASGSAGTVVYADRPTTVSGTVTCQQNAVQTDNTASNVKVTFNVKLNLKQGWNSVVASSQGKGTWKKTAVSVTGDNLEGTFNLESRALPTAWMALDLGMGKAVLPDATHP